MGGSVFSFRSLKFKIYLFYFLYMIIFAQEYPVVCPLDLICRMFVLQYHMSLFDNVLHKRILYTLTNIYTSAIILYHIKIFVIF